MRLLIGCCLVAASARALPAPGAPVDTYEVGLLKEVSAQDGPDEIFAVVWLGDGGEKIAVRVRGERAHLTLSPDSDRIYERDLSAAELKALRDRAAGGLYDANAQDFKFLDVTRRGARRVYLEDQKTSPGIDTARRQLFEQLHTLSDDRPGFELHYRFAGTIPGLEILVDDPVWEVTGVRGAGLVQVSERSRASPSAPQALPFKNLSLKPRELAQIHREGLLWVRWPSGVQVTADELAAHAVVRPVVPPNLIIDLNYLHSRNRWAAERGGAGYVAGFTDKHETGVFRISAAGRAPELIAKGPMLNPVLSPDGGSVVVEEEQWKPHGAALIDLTTKASRRIDIPFADNVTPLFANSQGVVVRRKRAGPGSNGPERPEHYLVESSGKVTKVEGDFAPFPFDVQWPPQPAGREKIWAVKGSSVVGVYDLRRFVFTPLKELPGFVVQTDRLWVDEPSHEIYVAHQGMLLRVPY